MAVISSQPLTQTLLPQVGELLDDVFRRSRGVTDQSQLTDFPLVFRPENFRNSRVILEDGKVVSHAALWPRTLVAGAEELRAGVIVSVATHPEYRGRGYARQLMLELQDLLQGGNYDLGVLWTSVPDFYQQLGWELVKTPGRRALLSAARVPVQTDGGLVIRPYQPERDLPEISRLYHEEPVRLHRSSDELRVLLALPKVDVWVAQRGDRLEGYLVHARAVNKTGFTEYGGTAAAISQLIGFVLYQHPQAEIPFLLVPTRPELVAWAYGQRLPVSPLECSKGVGAEMILPVNADRVSESLRKKLFFWGLDHV